MADVKILAIGAHPDDCELKAGGCAALWADRGYTVRFVSMTNGHTGHFAVGGGPLARTRRSEAAAAAAVIGIESQVVDINNGELMPDVPTRKQLITIIREYAPDLILTHRPNDYHPDHRYTSQLVQDSSYQMSVPNFVPLTPINDKSPVIMYFADDFKKPWPFTPDVAVDISSVVDKKVAMVACHVSQVYEWLPWTGGRLAEVPTDEAERLAWLTRQQQGRYGKDAARCRDLLASTYGERGRAIPYAESFELCEYGAPLTAEARARLFPFLPE